jgi:hypothetical protein
MFHMSGTVRCPRVASPIPRLDLVIWENSDNKGVHLRRGEHGVAEQVLAVIRLGSPGTGKTTFITEVARKIWMLPHVPLRSVWLPGQADKLGGANKA